jgi:hypothetical protein
VRRIKAKKIGIGKGQHWEWELPKDGKDGPENASSPDLAAFEEDTETKTVNSTTSPKAAKDGNMAAFAGKAGNLHGELANPDGLPLTDDAIEV